MRVGGRAEDRWRSASPTRRARATTHGARAVRAAGLLAVAFLVSGCGGEQDIRNLADLRAPEPVAALAATPGDARVRLTWEAGENLELIAYQVYRSLEEDSGFELVGSVGRADRPYYEDAGRDRDSDGVPDGLVNGLAYYYRVLGVDREGRDGLISLASTAQAIPAVAPGSFRDLQVSNVRVHAGPERILVTWDPVLGQAVSGYRVYREDLQAPGEPSLLGTAAPGVTHFVDAAVDDTEDYRYLVAPVDRIAGDYAVLRRTGPDDPEDIRTLVTQFGLGDDEGRRQASRVVSPAVSDSVPPLAPGHNLAAGALLHVETGTAGVTLEWGRPLQTADGEFFATESEADAMIGGGYVIHRARAGRGAFTPFAILEQTGSEAVFEYTDPLGTIDDVYMVRAFDRFGTLGFESRRVSGGALPLPDLVRGVDAFAGVGAQQILVSWSPDSRATAGYRVFRSRYRDRGYQAIANVAPTVTGLPDGADVALGETWWYRVAPLTQDIDGDLLQGALSSPAVATPGPSAGSFYLQAEDASFQVGVASAADIGELRRRGLPRPWSGRGALEVPYNAGATAGATTFALTWVTDIVVDASGLRPVAHDVYLLVRRDDRAPTLDVAVSALGSTFPLAASDLRQGIELFESRFGFPSVPTMERVGNIAFEDQRALGGTPQEVIQLTVTLQNSDPLLQGDRRLLIDGVLLVRR